MRKTGKAADRALLASLLCAEALLAGCGELSNDWESWNLNVSSVGEGVVTIDPDGVQLETTVCPGLCDQRFHIAVTEIVTLSAAADPGWDFDRWEDGGSDYHPCAFPTSLPTSIATITVQPPREDRRHAERPNVECRAIFVQASVSSSHAYQLNGPAGSSIYDTAVDDTGSVTGIGDSTAAVPANIVDGYLLTSPSGATAFGPSGAMGRKVVLPGAQPVSGSPAGSGAMAIVGATFNPNGAWVARLGADGALNWQVHLGATVDDANEVATVDADEMLVFGRLAADSTQFVAVVGSGGVVTSATRIDSTAFPSDIQAAAAGGYVAVSSVFLNPNRDSFVVRVNGAGAIAWQKSFTGGFVEVTGSVETTDGGAVVFGRAGATGATATGWIAELDNTGAVQWQKSYGDSTAIIRITGVVVRSSDVVSFVRDSTNTPVAMTLDSDGLVTSARSYADSGAAASQAIGAGKTPGGGMALASARQAAGEFLMIQTAPDLSLTGCGDASLGAVVAATAIPVADGTVTVADSTFALSSLTPFTTTPTAVTTEVTAVPAVDLCTN